jgi:hypothetical protein
MESNIEVALAVKLQKLFPPTEEKFLSFPMGECFTYDDLDFMGDDEGLSAGQLSRRYLSRAMFAMRTNLVPADRIIYSPDASRYLWDEYREVLNNAQLAVSILTESERHQLEEAEEFLYGAASEDAIDVGALSEPHQKYIQYKRAWENAEKQYLDEKLTVETSRDDELKEQWEAGRERELASIRDRAMDDWIHLGCKQRVEECRAVKARLRAKSPSLYVQGYRGLLEACHETVSVEDPVGTYITLYSPLDCFDNDRAWVRVNMTRNEVDSLLQSAPPELAKFASAEAVDIESISLEYSEVSIVRNWFKPGFFASRYWRLPSTSAAVSDGDLPRGGRIPAFVTSMLVTKKVEVTRKKAEAPKQPALRFSFVAKNLTPLRHDVFEIKGAERTPAAPHIRPILAEPTVPRRRVSAPMAARAVAARVATPVNLRAIAAVRKVDRVAAKPVVVTALKAAAPPPPRPKPEEEGSVCESLELDGVAVIAYVCRRIPESPNPDENLAWSA